MRHFNILREIEEQSRRLQEECKLEEYSVAGLKRKILDSEKRLSKLQYWNPDLWLQEKEKVLKPHVNQIEKLRSKIKEQISEIEEVIKDAKAEVESLSKAKEVPENILEYIEETSRLIDELNVLKLGLEENLSALKSILDEYQLIINY